MRIIFACIIFLLSLMAGPARGDDYTKNIEIVEADIRKNYEELPVVAYLYITLKNNGDRKVSNATFEISYFGDEDYLIQRAVIKNALNDVIPKGESRKYRIRLKGDFVNLKYEQYPYSKNDNITDFDIKIISVKHTK